MKTPPPVPKEMPSAGSLAQIAVHGRNRGDVRSCALWFASRDGFAIARKQIGFLANILFGGLCSICCRRKRSVRKTLIAIPG
jgi:hypothetical protein